MTREFYGLCYDHQCDGCAARPETPLLMYHAPDGRDIVLCALCVEYGNDDGRPSEPSAEMQARLAQLRKRNQEITITLRNAEGLANP
jgi:hypothetical protein